MSGGRIDAGPATSTMFLSRRQFMAVGAASLMPAIRVSAGTAARQVPEPPARGTSMNLSSTPEQTREADFNVFEVAPGEPLLLRLIFVSQHERPTEFRILMLLNYRQAVLGWAEAPALVADPHAEPIPPLESWTPVPADRHALEFSARLEEPQWLHLWTEPLSPGYYDLAIIVVPDFRLTATEAGYFTTYRPFLRGAVYVGPAVPPAPDYPILDPDARPLDSTGADSLLFTRQPYSQQMNSAATIIPGALLSLNADWAPTDLNLPDNQLPTSPLPTAFVCFIEDQQVPFSGELVKYGAGVPNTLNSLPISVAAPAVAGRYQLFLQQFPNPYVDPAYAYETGREFYAESSQRYTLEVEPE